MKLKIILFVVVLILGGFAVILPGVLSSNSEVKQLSAVKAQEQKQSNLIKEIESSGDKIEVQELPPERIETENYDKEQMYFEGIEALYEYLKFGQVEAIKQKVQSFVHLYVSDALLDCSFVSGSIRQEDSVLIFGLSVASGEEMLVMVSRDSKGDITDIAIDTKLP